MSWKFVSILIFSIMLLVSCSTKDAENDSEGDQDYVYVIQDETKYHKRDCRYVRSNQNVDNMPKGEAEILGYDQCFLCRP